MLEALVLVAVRLARCLLNEGARRSSEKQAITPVRYDEGTIAINHNATTGERGYHNTSPPCEGPYMQIHRKLRHEQKQSGEFGEWIDDAALHNQ